MSKRVETWQLRAQFAVSHYTLDWMAGAIGHHIHNPYDLYEEAAS